MSSADLPAGVPGESRFVDVGDVELHAVVAGPADGDLVVLLHGFPEFWYGWREQIRPLANEGFRVVVPDQRGYNRSDKPPAVADYHIEEFVGDLAGLVDAFGRDSAFVVGHDIGGGVAWWAALERPELVDRVVAVNSPHPTAMYRALRSDWGQRLRSLYMLGFQLPGFGRLSRLGNWRPVVRGMRRSSNPGTFSREEMDRYREAWSQPGAFEAMLNWYRVMVRERPRPSTDEVTVPARIVWGVEDEFLKRSLAHDSLSHCANGTMRSVDGATHWVQHEYPVVVADEIIEHLRGRIPTP